MPPACIRAVPQAPGNRLLFTHEFPLACPRSPRDLPARFDGSEVPTGPWWLLSAELTPRLMRGARDSMCHHAASYTVPEENPSRLTAAPTPPENSSAQ
ncbi:hypothetical protein OPT61_g8758 [Boeremia exigua]|uniref:Uncharacterized protein n=1 Tax=Boeremia exigua TaxID=749465 RepID=A0ACC2HWY9_9PLEO|nr:hypothetical protein OPT61_g8758 [Boeremia exigua]